MPVMPAPGRVRQEACYEFHASIDYTVSYRPVRPSLKVTTPQKILGQVWEYMPLISTLETEPERCL